METEEMFFLSLATGLFIKIILIDKIEAINKSISELPIMLLSFIINPIFIIFTIILSSLGLTFWAIRHRNLRLEKERLEIEKLKERKIEEEAIQELLKENINRLNSDRLENLIQRFDQYNHDPRIRNKIINAKEKLRNTRVSEYKKTEEFRKKKLSEEIEALRKQRYLEELRLKDYHDAVLEKLKIEETLIYENRELNKKEIEALEKEDYKKINEYDPIKSKNTTFLVKQILNHSPSHTFLVARIKQLLEKYIDIKKIKIHETRDADITFEIKYKIYAFEIEKGSLLNKKNQLEKKVSFLNNKYGQNWYFIVTNRDLSKKYRKYGKVTSRMGVRKIIEKLVRN
ncbi:MAG: hypothetical protein V1888_02975 [archaeon]